MDGIDYLKVHVIIRTAHVTMTGTSMDTVLREQQMALLVSTKIVGKCGASRQCVRDWRMAAQEENVTEVCYWWVWHQISNPPTHRACFQWMRNWILSWHGLTGSPN